LPRQSLVRWVHLASEWLKPIYREIKHQMMSGPYIQIDETPIKYLDPGNGKTGQGYFWVAHRPGEDVLFEWHTTREAKCLQKLIPIDFRGTIQCDGYSAYDHFAKHRASEGKAVLLAGCWSHTRRAFYEALDHAPKEAAWISIQVGRSSTDKKEVSLRTLKYALDWDHRDESLRLCWQTNAREAVACIE
jgi:transposase